MGLSTAATVALAASAGVAGGTILSSALSSSPKAPAAPPPPPAPAPSPTLDSDAVRAAQRKQAAAAAQASGRAATILSQDQQTGTSDKLGS
jgi:hypothetical protein